MILRNQPLNSFDEEIYNWRISMHIYENYKFLSIASRHLPLSPFHPASVLRCWSSRAPFLFESLRNCGMLMLKHHYFVSHCNLYWHETLSRREKHGLRKAADFTSGEIQRDKSRYFRRPPATRVSEYQRALYYVESLTWFLISFHYSN